MTIKISKSEVNLREKIGELDKPSSVAGESMLRANTPQEQFNLIGAGRRNLIINGDFRFSQRGDYTSTTTLTNSATYYLDRWKFYTFVNTSGTFQHKLDQTLPDGTVTNTHLHTSTSSDMNAPLVQMIEDHKAVWDKYFTVSFWYKSNKETYYNIWNGTSQVHFLVPSSSGQWEKWEKTYKLKENGAYFRLEFYSHIVNMTSGSYLELAQVQIELGKVATPFEHRLYGEELALCQRYYYKINSAENNANYQRFAMVNIETSTQAEALFIHPVTMRAIPTLETTAVSGFHIFSANAISVVSGMAIDQASPYSVGVALTASGGGLTAGYVGLLDANNNKTAQIAFDAEL